MEFMNSSMANLVLVNFNKNLGLGQPPTPRWDKIPTFTEKTKWLTHICFYELQSTNLSQVSLGQYVVGPAVKFLSTVALLPPCPTPSSRSGAGFYRGNKFAARAAIVSCEQAEWKNMWICNCREKKSGYIKNCIVQLNWTLAVSLIVSRAWTHSGDGWHASRTRNCLTWRRPRPLSSAHLDNATSAERGTVAQRPANLLPRHGGNFKDG